MLRCLQWTIVTFAKTKCSRLDYLCLTYLGIIGYLFKLRLKITLRQVNPHSMTRDLCGVQFIKLRATVFYCLVCLFLFSSAVEGLATNYGPDTTEQPHQSGHRYILNQLPLKQSSMFYKIINLDLVSCKNSHSFLSKIHLISSNGKMGAPINLYHLSGKRRWLWIFTGKALSVTGSLGFCCDLAVYSYAYNGHLSAHVISILNHLQHWCR